MLLRYFFEFDVNRPLGNPRKSCKTEYGNQYDLVRRSFCNISSLRFKLQKKQQRYWYHDYRMVLLDEDAKTTPRPVLLSKRVSRKNTGNNLSGSLCPTTVTSVFSHTKSAQGSLSGQQSYARNRSILAVGILILSAVSAAGYLSNTLPENLNAILEPFSSPMLLVCFAIYFVSGLCKGFAGIGMGLITVPLISLIYNPVLAVSLVIIPMLVTNLHQGVVTASVRKTVKEYGWMAFFMLLISTPVAYLSSNFSPIFLELAIGLSALVFVFSRLGFWAPVIAHRHVGKTKIGAGIVTGLFGGITGLAVIPLMIYMMTSDIKKERVVEVASFFFFLSAVSLLIGYILNGTLTKSLFVLSALMVAPALAGTLLAEIYRQLISEKTFRTVVLFLLCIIGAKAIITPIFAL